MLSTFLIGRWSALCLWAAVCLFAPTAARAGELAAPVLPALPEAVAPEEVPSISVEPPALRPADAAPIVTPARSLWLVSTREAGCSPADEPALRCWKHVEGQGWLLAELDEFFAADRPGVPTVFFVHGNRINFCESQQNGYRAYCGLSSQTPADQPFRFVVWSWPADQIPGVLDDVRLKASRSDYEAYPLAWFIQRIHPKIPVSLLGYSYGARVSTGALHILGGGEICGRAFHLRAPVQRAPMRSVLMAAALDNHWLAAGHRHGQALAPVDRMLVFQNPADKVLKHYYLLYGHKHRRGPQALGATGAAGWLGEHTPKVQHVNVTGVVGSTHDWSRYMESPQLLGRMRPYALFER